MHSAGVGLLSMDHCLQDASSIIGHAHGRSIIGSGNDGTTIASPLTPVHYHRQEQQQQQQQQQHHHQHHLHHPGGYGTADSWVDMNAYDHNPMSDYGSYGYIPPVAHSLPSPDSMSGRMAPPPPLHTMQPHHQLHHHQQHQQQHQQHQQQHQQQQQQQPQHHQQQHHHQPHHQLPMLIMPSHTTWPSMLTNPQSYSAPPISSLPLTAVGKTRLPGMGPSQPRRTLTDDDRRRMCQYHEDNPTVKQTEIGAMFGVERSTVSKVLRNKEKYLFPDDRSNSPIRRTKGKFPDIERALASWARKAQLSGADLSDAEIWEKARHFARGVGGNTDSHVKTLSSSWLEKFKLKNGLGSSGGGRLLRRASEANIIGSSRLSGLSPSLTPASPTSGPSPLSGSRSDEDIKDGMPFIGFDQNGFKHSASQSVSASGAGAGAYCQPPDTAVSYGGETMSPGAAFTFSSPDSSSNAFLANDPSRNMPPGVFQRPRSQTFPTLDLEYLNQSGGGGDGGPATGKYPPGVENAIASDLDSPDQDAAPPQPSSSFPIDTALSSPTPLLHHSRSSGSLGGRTAAGANSSATPLVTASLIPASLSSGSSPTSPTQEDARRAATTLLNFIQSLGSNGQLFDQNEYITVVRLTEKLRLHTHGPSSATSTAPSSEPHSIGGLSRIPEGENEMSAVSMTSPIKTEVTMTS